jgi:four helix bundle protein
LKEIKGDKMLHEKLRCYQLAVEMAGALSKEAATWPRGMGYLVDQMRRAMSSVVLNVSEGNGRRSTLERRRFFEIARSSVAEVDSCIDLMLAFNLINQQKGMMYKDAMDNISKMLWGLIRINRS